MARRTTPARILVTADAVGGVWNYAIDLARGLHPLGIETVLALTGPAPSAGQAALALGLPGVTLIETGLGLDWLEPSRAAVARAARRIAELAGDLHADVAHLNAPALADARYAMPTLAVAHSCLATWWSVTKDGPLDPDFQWRDATTRAGLHAADAVLAPSHAHARATMRLQGLSTLPTVVHNGRTPLAVAGTSAPAHAVFTAGRLWDQGKDVATLDAAAVAIEAPFAAAGPVRGPNGETIRLSRLQPLGFVEDARLCERLAARPVFASAARYEPFGLAVLEAAQAGCALVLADIPVFRELWGDAAAFAAPGDARGFARAITAFLDDPAARAAAGEAALVASRAYTVTAMASGTAALYRTLLSARRAAA